MPDSIETMIDSVVLAALTNVSSDLNVAFTHPEHRRQGAGNMLMEWGTKKADEMGLETWVDATPSGEELYKKHSFVIVRFKDLQPRMENPSEDWKQMEKHVMPLRGTLMWRPVGDQHENAELANLADM